MRWLKDCIIQIVFIISAIVSTVIIANISISGQYTDYYEGKLHNKTEMLARNSAQLFDNTATPEIIERTLELMFPIDAGGTEIIRYAVFDARSGEVVAGNVGHALSLMLPPEFTGEQVTLIEDDVFHSYAQLAEQPAYVVMLQIDDEPFREHGRLLTEELYASLMRGGIMMAVSYLIFSAITNLKKKKKNKNAANTENDESDDEDKGGFKPNFSVGDVLPQMLSHLIFMLSFGVICAVCALFYFEADLSEAARIGVMLFGIVFGALCIMHICRVVIWVIAWRSSRPMSGYAAQTMQFCIFLLVFLSIFSYSMKSNYATQLELSRQDELRLSSLFGALLLSEDEMQELDFGENNELVVIHKDAAGNFVIEGNKDEDLTPALDLLISAWETKTTVTGVRGDYMYGMVASVDYASGDSLAIVAVRQSFETHSMELRAATTDFLLAMSATVFAFVFLFIEFNRLLEVLNTPNRKLERHLRYAGGTRSLMFFATAARYIPLYFFVLIVQDIYIDNPVSWLPVELASVLPIVVVLPVMMFGASFANWLVRNINVNSSSMMVFGCLIGAAGFALLNLMITVGNIWLFLILLAVTYTGVSMIYNGLWDYAYYAVDTGHDKFCTMKEDALSAEYLGCTAGATIGAMVYDKLGLFAALLISAGILLGLVFLVRYMFPRLPQEEEELHEDDGAVSIGFWKFIFSKRVILCSLCLFMPFVLGEYFIEQFSPLYADTIFMSPGAASWNSLLMTITFAYLGTPIVGLIIRYVKGLKPSTIGVISNFISVGGLLVFALRPGILTMYIASAIIGISLGMGMNVISQTYSELKESQAYSKSDHLFNLFESLFAQIGALLFTLVHTISETGEYVLAIAVLIAGATAIYYVSTIRRRRA